MVNFIAIFGMLAFCHAIFLAVFFWRRQEGNVLSNRLLALLLLALAVRITKSVIGIVVPGTGRIAPVLGVAGMVLIGPFLWLYLKSVLEKWTYLPRRQLFHFVLPALFVVTFPFFQRSLIASFYEAAVALMSVYVTGSAFLLIRKLKVSVPEKFVRQWMRLLTATITVILATYYVQLIVDSSRTYLLITACAALILYLLSFWGMSRMKVFSKNSSYHAAPAEGRFLTLSERITCLFEKEKTYTDPGLTVHRLAERLEVPSYLLSKAINTAFRKSFPELLHEYRIAEAGRRLLDPDSGHLSIEGIAIECGFQSASAFYAAFKKANGMSPAEWRRRHLS